LKTGQSIYPVVKLSSVLSSRSDEIERTIGQAIHVRVGRPSFDAFDQFGLSLDRLKDFLPVFNFSLPNSVVVEISLIHHETLDHRWYLITFEPRPYFF